ncbi:MAG: pyrroline-5-carboxylate reductase [Endomicrobium sp.]|jgi:pyrroline-5-carboxylate reductase|nr:pyrroline-5-carboxylate reductase [Endomicrobium sp.]
MEINKKFFFIGSGNMASAIIGGILESNIVKSENIVCNDVVKEKVINLQKKYGVSIVEDKGEATIEADIIFLSVKPQDIPKVLDEIRHFVRSKTIIVSIVAGITTKFIEESIQKNTAVIRTMPNSPALVRSGATALCKGRFVSGDQLQRIKDLFVSIGKAEILDEKNFDIITALSGSGPAYIFYFCELMQKAAEKLGLDKNISKTFAIQTVYGAGKMLSITNEPAEILKEKVKSPNGTTEVALKYFESQKLQNIVYEAMNQAMKKSKTLSK